MGTQQMSQTIKKKLSFSNTEWNNRFKQWLFVNPEIIRRKTGEEFYNERIKHLSPLLNMKSLKVWQLDIVSWCFVIRTSQNNIWSIALKKLKQNIINSPNVIFRLQKRQGKWYHENNDHQIQNVENSLS